MAHAIQRYRDGLPTSRQTGEKLRLLIVEGNQKKQGFCLLGEHLVIGRDEDCDITVVDQKASRRHAELYWSVDGYFVRDLQSANGTFLNNEKIDQAKLKAGDLLAIGLTVFEVYPAGQAVKNELMLRKQAAVIATAGAPGGSGALIDKVMNHFNKAGGALTEEDRLKKYRIWVASGLFFLLYVAYCSTPEKTQTFREHTFVQLGEEMESRPMSKKEAKEAVVEYTPDYGSKTQQRKDAEVFFRNGVREVTNKNFRRALLAFDTALTVDPTFDLAKVYIQTTKKDFEKEVKKSYDAAIQARKSGRWKEARMHYNNVLRYLEGDGENQLFKDSKAALELMDKQEEAR